MHSRNVNRVQVQLMCIRVVLVLKLANVIQTFLVQRKNIQEMIKVIKAVIGQICPKNSLSLDLTQARPRVKLSINSQIN